MDYRILTALVALLLLGNAADAQQIYRWVDDEGVVHYSDQPPEDDAASAEAVKLDVQPGIGNPSRELRDAPAVDPFAGNGSVSAEEAAQQLLAAQEPDAQAASAGPTVAYTDLEILEPQAGEVLWNIATQLPVAATLTPGLQGEHEIQWILDGQPVGSPTRSLSQTLTPVYRGTHSIAANVLDEQGRTLFRSNAVTFYVQQTTINRAR
ncbi:MAG: DUF4124 domain-containing protein [Pseudomonadota bacterium]